MRTSRWFLRAALALPIVLLIGLAFRTWVLEGAQLELEYQSSVRRVALEVGARLERWRDGEPWPGERLAGSGASPLPSRREDARRRDRLVLLGTQLERLIARDGAEAGASWLADLIAADDDVGVVAWARLRAAGLARQLGDAESARATWDELARADNGRDERGIRFDLAARALTLLRAPAAESAAALAEELASDQLDAEDIANAALCARVLEVHAQCCANSQVHTALEARVRELRRDAAWRSLRRTLDARSASAPQLELVSEHGGWLIAVAPDQAGGSARVRGLPVERVQSDLFGGATGELIVEFGIRMDLVAPDGWRWASSSPLAEPMSGDAYAREELPSGTGVVAVAVEPSSAAAERRSSRRQVWLLAIGIAVVGALLAGVLGLRALRKQEQLNEDRAGFVAAVSHELKTPLTATRLLGELLERGDLDEAKVREFGGRIARESERLDQLVRSVLDLARVERIGLEPGRAELETPAQLLAEAIERHELAMEKGETPPVCLAATGDEHVRVYVDREAVLAALANLLENAARHAADSDSIELGLVEAGDRVRFEVRDRGPGVPEHEREAIFGEFKRGGSEDTRSTRGTGIGLALVARIAQAHGGRAFCGPRAGGGAVFTLELPKSAARGEDVA